jgi:hypothetical protein
MDRHTNISSAQPSDPSHHYSHTLHKFILVFVQFSVPATYITFLHESVLLKGALYKITGLRIQLYIHYLEWTYIQQILGQNGTPFLIQCLKLFSF